MNKKVTRSFLTICCLTLIPLIGFSQKAKTHVLTTDEAKLVKKDAATQFSTQDYSGALASYKDLIKADPKNVDYNYKLAYCYLQTSADKKAALPYIEFACKAKEAKKEWSFYLGLANMYNEKFDDAITAFKDFRDSKIKPFKEYPTADRMIEMCNNGKELIEKPVKIKYTNLGKTINTPFEEYNPFISADGKSLIFTSRRKGNVGGFIADLGIYTADVYSSVWKDTIWAKAKGAGGLVNTEWDEETVGYSADGNMMVLYFDNAEYFGDVGVGQLKGKMWQKPILLPPTLNTKSTEGSATVSLDGTVIIFSSDIKGGLGESDLYMIKKEKNGEWSAAVNLGATINTRFSEDSPNLSLDGKTLYFASEGWNSMGGFDIFRSEWDEVSNKWGIPENIGYPINDADDNNFISFTGDGKSAYIAAVRPEGFGDKDIYKIDFEDQSNHKFTSFISGVVSTTTGGKVEITRVYLEDKNTGKQTVFVPNAAFNDFILPALPGDYVLHVEGYNFAAYSEDLKIEANAEAQEIVHNVQVKSSK
jgi:hypothetical protein